MPVSAASPSILSAMHEDHRVRVARVKRERMRAHLFQSVLMVCSGRKTGMPAVIDDVVRHAKVSRGTFYKYFDSLDQAIAELAMQLADEMTEDISAVYDVLEDPVQRTATGFETFLARALIDPDWGAFITHIGLLSYDNNLLGSKIRSDIRLGIETGDYVVKSVDLATDLLIGVKVEAIRRIIGGERDTAYMRGITEMVLRSFGVTPSKAEKCVQKAYNRLHVEAPGKLAWWRSLD